MLISITLKLGMFTFHESHPTTSGNSSSATPFQPINIVYSLLFPILGNPAQHPTIPANNPIQIGCNTHVPTCCANNPVKNGATAPPEEPNALTAAKLDICSLLGINWLNTAVAHGYTGPKSKPTMETATASPTTFGTSQTRSWKAVAPRMRRTTAFFSPMR